MARIVSKLNLNKTPQLVENNSLIFAKNVKLLKDGSIGQDDSTVKIPFDDTILRADIEARIEESEKKIAAWSERIAYLQANDIEVDLLACYKEYIETHRFTETGGIVSGYQYIGGSNDTPIFKLVNPENAEYINHIGNTIPEEDAVNYFNAINNLHHTELKFPFFPKELYEYFGDIITGPSKTPYLEFDYSTYYDEIAKLRDSADPTDVEYFKDNFEIFPAVYPTDYTKAYDGRDYYYNAIYGWMLSWFLLTHATDITKIINEAKLHSTSDDNKIESEIKLLTGYIERETQIIKDYNNYLDSISNIDDYDIVGVIPYNTEFYLFLYKPSAVIDNVDVPSDSLICKYEEGVGFTICPCNWQYSGGIIDGKCVVNLNGDTLLNICEYTENNITLVPIKTINLNEASKEDDESIYTQTPKINLFNLSFLGYYSNTIPAGTYQFFIRYEIKDNYYTNWFPASKELFAGTQKVIHTPQGSLQYIDDSIDSGKSFHFLVDKLYYNVDLNYKSFQIGFLLAHDDEIYARAWKKFDLDVNDIYFDYTKDYIEEITVEELLENTYGLFNVKNLTAFKNKLYVANYIETDFNPDLQNWASANVNVRLNTIVAETSQSYYYNYPIVVETNGSDKFITTIDGVTVVNIVRQCLNSLQTNISLCNFTTNKSITYKGVTMKVSMYGTPSTAVEDYKYALKQSGQITYEVQSNDFSDIVSWFTTNYIYVRSDGQWYVDINTSSTPLSTMILFVTQGNITHSMVFDLSIAPSYVSITNSEKKQDIYTLMPGQSYDFYVHFVKDTGEYTNGYKFDSKTVDFATYETNISKHEIIYPVFSFNSTLPKGYIAAFISMQHTSTLTAEVFNSEDVSETINGTDVHWRIADCLDLDAKLYTDYDNLKIVKPSIPNTPITGDYKASYDNTTWKLFGSSGKILITSGVLSDNTQAFVVMPFESNNKFTQLIRVTPYIYYTSGSFEYDNYIDLNLISYICGIRKFKSNLDYYVSGNDVYIKSFTVDANNTPTFNLDDIDTDGEFNDWSKVDVVAEQQIYSNFNLNYLSVTDDLNPQIMSFNVSNDISNPDYRRGIYVLVQSMLLSDIYELKSMFKSYTRKTYLPYSDTAVIKFDNTIRSSVLQGDESKIYAFKFNTTDYYNVPTDKGIIVNLVAIGDAIVVHTEDSMYKFSGSNTLSSTGGENVAMKEGEPFDTGIQEIFGSEYGFAGLQHKKQHVITENGYTFFDSDSKTLYLYGGQQQVIPISDDIEKLLNRDEIVDVKFANDYYNDRIFINISYADNCFVNLTYNFRVKSFISLHDFNFDRAFNTKTKCYFLRQSKLYVIEDRDIRSYDELRDNDGIYPQLNSWGFNVHGIFYDSSEKASIVDVIFKEDYENVKTLNAIDWICNLIQGFNYTDGVKALLVAEEKLMPYAGGFLRIYSDSASTDSIAIYDASNPYAIATYETNDTLREEQRNMNPTAPRVPNPSSYKKPRYNLGKWNLNYFRNILNTDDITNSRSVADNKSLIYGKYIVVRFVFNCIDNFKLEDVGFNIAPMT